MSVVLCEHLPLLATAPDGIQKLRGLILELAVRGKLVPQDPNDEPASELLKRIAQERARLEAEGICKKSNATPLVGEDEQPFSVPCNWAWVRLPEVYFSISPSSNKLLSSAIQESGAVPVVDQGKRYIAGYTDQASMLIKIPGPVVIFGDHTTERKYVDFDFVAGADGVKILRPILQFERFFFWQLKAFKLEERGYARHFKVLNDHLYALPPLAEQHRIVAKVDELMALCDRLEAEQTDAEAAHARLVETLLGTLTQSADAADLAASVGKTWQRLAEHFDTLFTTESSLDALKQTILQLAVKGKLVPQEPNDEPASELLKRIAQERARLEAEGVCKKSKATPPVGEDEQPFAVPNGWIWTTIESISFVGTGTTPSRTNPEYFNPPLIPWVTSGETRDPFISMTAEKVSPLALKETNLTIYPVGTLVVAMYGQGKTRGQVSELRIEATTNQACSAIAPLLPNIELRKYIKLFFEKIYDEIREEAAGGAQPNLNVGKIKATLISLPPLAEQHRIVAKVDELMALCDRLKADLAESRARQARLSATLIESALQAA